MAVPTKGNTTNANPTPGANFKNQTHTHNVGSDGLIVAQFTMSNARSFTNSGGVGNSLRTGGSATPNTQNLTVSDDSLVMITSCSINAITSQQIPTGTNRTYTQHNTNRQVATGAISADTGHSAGTISLRSTSTFGNVSLDRTEILGISSSDTSGGDFFLVM